MTIKRIISSALLLVASPSMPYVTGVGDIDDMVDGPFLDGFEATSDYDKQNIEGFTVYVSGKLLQESPELVDEVIVVMRGQLDQLVRLATHSSAVDQFRQIKIWLSSDACGGLKARAAYHKGEGWLRWKGLNPDMADSVEVCDMQAILDGMNQFRSTFIHELAHGFHHQFMVNGFDNEQVYETYESAVADGSYHYVLRGNGSYGIAYGLTNEREYFAGLLTAYLGTDREYPFVWSELKAHDPRGYHLAGGLLDADAESRWLDCSLEDKTRSRSGAVRVAIRFRNATDETRHVVWLDYEGERSPTIRTTLAPNHQGQVSTWSRHPWIVLDDDAKCVTIFDPGWDDETVEIKQ